MRVLIALAVSVLAACYKPTVTSCQYACGADGSCPDGTTCTAGACVIPGDTCDTSSNPPPAPPGQLSPYNGAYTGSALVAASLQPTLRWATAPAATSYNVDLDSTCRSIQCPFTAASVVHVTDLPTTSYQPASALAQGRIGWRVQACNVAGCSPWSTPRYLNVGMLRDDLDGDGMSELAIGGRNGEPSVTVIDKVASGGALTLASACNGPEAEMYWGQALAVGNFAGDDTPDLVIDGQADTLNDDNVYVYPGSSTLTAGECPTNGMYTVAAPAGHVNWGMRLTTVGDLDGDGYDDFIAYGAGPDGDDLWLVRGAQAGPVVDSAPITLPVGYYVPNQPAHVFAGVGDLDGDGFVDIALTVVEQTKSTPLAVAIAFGGTTTAPDASRLLINAPAGSETFGLTLAIADLDGDGRAELYVGATDGNGMPRLYQFDDVTTGTATASITNADVAGSSNEFALTALAPVALPDGTSQLAVGDYDAFSVFLLDAQLAVAASVSDMMPSPQDHQFGTTLGTGDFTATGYTSLGVGAGTFNADKSGGVFVYTRDATGFTLVGTQSDPNDRQNEDFGIAISP